MRPLAGAASPLRPRASPLATPLGSPYAIGPLSACLSVYPIWPVYLYCNVGVLWPNGWMHQDETWHAGRPRL